MTEQTETDAGRVATPTPADRAAPSKAAMVAKLLGRPRGATVAEMMAVTNWQNHSVRAFLTGLRKKGRTLVREERRNGTLAYRLAAGESER